jgi:hypothetical protein
VTIYSSFGFVFPEYFYACIVSQPSELWDIVEAVVSRSQESNAVAREPSIKTGHTRPYCDNERSGSQHAYTANWHHHVILNPKDARSSRIIHKTHLKLKN